MAQTSTSTTTAERSEAVSRNPLVLILAWTAVGAPLLWGVLQTLKKAMALFQI